MQRSQRKALAAYRKASRSSSTFAASARCLGGRAAAVVGLQDMCSCSPSAVVDEHPQQGPGGRIHSCWQDPTRANARRACGIQFPSRPRELTLDLCG